MDSDIKINVPDSVYPPYEDSRLLADCALKECDGKILEVGCGSGFVSISISKLKPKSKVYALDINSDAVKAAKENAKANKAEVEIIKSDMFSKLKEKNFDWILFNPPYLPTSEAEKIEGGLNFAFDGGKSGLDTVFMFLEQVKNYLKKEGKVLIVASTEQDLNKLNSKIKECQFSFGIIAEQSFFFEKIYIYRLERE